MYYQEWEAMHLIQIGCLEPVSQDSREYWEPIPQAVLEAIFLVRSGVGDGGAGS